MKKLALFLCAIMIFTVTPVVDYALPAQQNAPIVAQAKAKKTSKIKLNKTKVTLVSNRTTKLKVKGTKKKVKWSSSNKKVAVVNKNGKVTAKKPGKAWIYAKVGKKTLKCKVTVIAGYDVSGEWYTDINGTRFYLSINAYSDPDDAAGMIYVYKNSPDTKYIYCGEYYEIAPNQYRFFVAGGSIDFTCNGTTINVISVNGAILKDFLGVKFFQSKSYYGN